MFYYTYVLKSLKDGKLYIGFSRNLKNRIKEHNNGLVLATKNRIPLKLVYYEACLLKKKAIEREKALKTLPPVQKKLDGILTQNKDRQRANESGGYRTHSS
jgi:putative endonuclease